MYMYLIFPKFSAICDSKETRNEPHNKWRGVTKVGSLAVTILIRREQASKLGFFNILGPICSTVCCKMFSFLSEKLRDKCYFYDLLASIHLVYAA